jgi:hypothetical protein
MELKDAKQRYQTETPHAALHHVSSLVTGTKFVPSLRIELKKHFFSLVKYKKICYAILLHPLSQNIRHALTHILFQKHEEDKETDYNQARSHETRHRRI